MRSGRLAVALLLGLIGLVMSPHPATAQATCAALVEQAIRAVQNNCQNTLPRTVCYAHPTAIATSPQQQPLPNFYIPGDRVELAALAELTTTPANLEQGTWGVAFMSFPQDVTAFLLGDAALLQGEVPFAFDYRTGTDDAPCAQEAPAALALRTGDVGAVQFQINQQPLLLNGAASLRWQTPNSMTITVHQGELMTAESILVTEGQTLAGVMDSDGAVAYWGAPRPLNDAERNIATLLSQLYGTLGVPFTVGINTTAVPTPSLADVPPVPPSSNTETLTDCATITHTVHEGENLFRIAMQYGTTVDAIVLANEIPNRDQISPGQVLGIPCAGEIPPQPDLPPPVATNCTFFYDVTATDQLQDLADQFNTSIESIITANNLLPGQAIVPGQQLLLPCP